MALISYGYWIREEGRTGEEGLRACRFELVLSYTVIGLFGLAVVIIGSRTSVRGQGNRARRCCSQISSQRSLGPSGKWIFLVGFWAAVFSALLGVWQSLPYLFTDFLLAAERVWSGFAAAGTSAERSRSLPRLSRMPRDRTAGSVALAGAAVTARVRTDGRDASAVCSR